MDECDLGFGDMEQLDDDRDFIELISEFTKATEEDA